MKTETLKTILFLNPIFWMTILAVALSISTCYPQDTSGDYDVLVGGNNYEHDMDVLFSFIDGYTNYDSSVYQGTIQYQPLTGLNLFAYAEANGYEMVIYSYGGANSYASYADNYPDIIIAMPAGSNSFQHVFVRDIDTCPMIITAAGADTNVTGYSTEFHSIDPITTDNLSSFANGYIAGQITYIAVSRGIIFNEARMIARETSSNVIWDEYSGYGLINIEDALAFIVPTPSEMVQDIINEIVELITTGDLAGNHAQPLITKLERVIDNLGKNKITLAIKQIDAFINKVKAYINSKKLTEEDGQSLIVSAEEVIDELILLERTSPELNEDNLIPNEYRLEQNYPNPFNPVTTIEYIIPEAGYVKLIVYDILGNKVETLVDGYVTSNNNKVIFNAADLASGTYIYSLSINEILINKKLIILK